MSPIPLGSALPSRFSWPTSVSQAGYTPVFQLTVGAILSIKSWNTGAVVRINSIVHTRSVILARSVCAI